MNTPQIAVSSLLVYLSVASRIALFSLCKHNPIFADGCMLLESIPEGALSDALEDEIMGDSAQNHQVNERKI